MQNQEPGPEFGPGDVVMVMCPAGPPPFPDGPALVKACTRFDPNTEESMYVLEFDGGRIELVDGVEIVSLDAWVDWMQRNAN